MSKIRGSLAVSTAIATLLGATLVGATLVATNVSLANGGVPWPEELPTAEFAQNRMFRSMQDYVRDLSVERVRAQPDVDTIELRSSFEGPDRSYLRLHVDRTVDPNRIVESIGISLGGRWSGALAITRTGKDLKPTPSADLLAFKFPDPTASETYQVSMNRFSIAVKFAHVDGGAQGSFDGGYFTLNYVGREKVADGGGMRLWSMRYPGYAPYGMQVDARPVAPGLWDFSYSYEGYYGHGTATDGLFTISQYFLSSLEGAGRAVMCRGVRSWGWPETTLMAQMHGKPGDPCQGY